MNVLAELLWAMGIAGASAAVTVTLLALVSRDRRKPIPMRYDPTPTLSKGSVECLRCGWMYRGGTAEERMAELQDHLLTHQEAAP